MKYQRMLVLVGSNIEHPQDHDIVIAGSHGLVDRALQPRTRVIDEDGTAVHGPPTQAYELGIAVARELLRNLRLLGSQHADPESPSGAQQRPRGGSTTDTHRDEWRDKGDAGEGTGCQSDWGMANERGDSGDTRGIRTEHAAKHTGIERYRIMHRAMVMPSARAHSVGTPTHDGQIAGYSPMLAR